MASARDPLAEPLAQLEKLKTSANSEPLKAILQALLMPELYQSASRFANFLQVKLKLKDESSQLVVLAAPLNQIYALLTPVFQSGDDYSQHTYYAKITDFLLQASRYQNLEPLTEDEQAEVLDIEASYAHFFAQSSQDDLPAESSENPGTNSNFTICETHYHYCADCIDNVGVLQIKVRDFKAITASEKSSRDYWLSKIMTLHLNLAIWQYDLAAKMTKVALNSNGARISAEEVERLANYLLYLRHQVTVIFLGPDPSTRYRLMNAFMAKVIDLETVTGMIQFSKFGKCTLSEALLKTHAKFVEEVLDCSLGGYTLRPHLQFIRSRSAFKTSNLRELLGLIKSPIQNQVDFYINNSSFEAGAQLLKEQKARLNYLPPYHPTIETALARLNLMAKVLDHRRQEECTLIPQIYFINFSKKTLDELANFHRQAPQYFVETSLQDLLGLAYEQALGGLLTPPKIISTKELELREAEQTYYSRVVHQQQLILAYQILIQMPYIHRYKTYSVVLKQQVKDLTTAEIFAAFEQHHLGSKLMDIVLDAIHEDEGLIADFGFKEKGSKTLDPALVVQTEAHYQKFCEELALEEAQFNQKMTKAFTNRRKHEKTKSAPVRANAAALFQPSPQLKAEKSPQAQAEIEGALFLQNRAYDQALVAYKRCQSLARAANDPKYIAAGMLGLSETYKMQALAATPSNFACPTEDKNFPKMRAFYELSKQEAKAAFAYFTQELAPKMDEYHSSIDQELDHLSCSIHLCLFNAENALTFIREKNHARVDFLNQQYERMVDERNAIRAKLGEQAWQHRENPQQVFAQLREETYEQKKLLKSYSADLEILSREFKPLTQKFAALAGKATPQLENQQQQLEEESRVKLPFRERLQGLAERPGLLRLTAN